MSASFTRLSLLVPLATLIAAAALAQTASAAVPAGGWTVRSIAEPTDFSSSGNAECNASHPPSDDQCARYVLLATNVSDRTTSAPVLVTDTLPAGIAVANVSAAVGGELVEPKVEPRLYETSGFSCTTTVRTVRCEYSGPPVVPGAMLAVRIDVEVFAREGALTNSVAVQGGGEGFLPVSATGVNPVGAAPAPFGVEALFMEPDSEAGAFETQAGAHPDALSTGFVLDRDRFPMRPIQSRYDTPQPPKNVIVQLPLGFLGDPLATPERCTVTELNQHVDSFNKCPPASQIGTVALDQGNLPFAGNEAVSALYNMVPEGGYPAEFGFTYLGEAATMEASVVPVNGAGGYALRVAVPGIPRAGSVTGVFLTFFGDPPRRDAELRRQQVEAEIGHAVPLEAFTPAAFLTDPSDCQAAPLRARIEVTSWEAPLDWSSGEAVSYPRITDCNLLRFEPSIAFTPQTTKADEASGYTFELDLPQAPNLTSDLATPPIIEATVTLPRGVSISPSAAPGLEGCTPEEVDIGSGGANLHETGPGEITGPDGLPHAAPGKCPPSSQIGSVQVKTPLLEEALEGGVYLAQPECGGAGQPACTSADAQNGSLYRVYVELHCSSQPGCATEAATHGSGVVVKLPGSVSVDTATGRITARFRENPQLPFEKLTLTLKGGPQAPLANPQSCGSATTTSDFTPWSTPSTPDATPSSAFTVDWNGAGEPCPARAPFSPSLLAQSTQPFAGYASPFALAFSRQDREQGLARIAVHLPPGLLAKIATVPRCGEPQAAAGTCPESARIGIATVQAGSGSDPLTLEGAAYLTGPYEGQPFGLSVAVPIVAGPFNLGTEVVRSAISVNPRTAEVTVTSDPLPQIKDGVPTRIKSVNVTVDRQGFMRDPTGCTRKQVTVTIESAQGATATVARPYAVTGCANLPFKPSFKVATSARHSRRDGAVLDVKVSQQASEAAIRKVETQLPKLLPARNSTLKLACIEAQFASNPARCPAGSFVGYATAKTPLLARPLTGPAIFVSHGGAGFPDLDVVLQGEDVTVILTGHTQIKKGITYSRFDTVPDAPISNFELKLPESTHSALAAFGNLCRQRLAMPTTITGQNGAILRQNTRIAVSGCSGNQARSVSHRHRGRLDRRHGRGRRGR